MRLFSLIACAAAAACSAREPAEDRVAEAPEAEARSDPAAPRAPPPAAKAPAPGPAAPAHPCLVDDGKPVTARLKALGTEPFWAAEVEGRCIVYRTPDDQAGTRIWARFSGTGDSGQWSGFLGERRFVLVTRAEPGCSDGMSDKRYPLAAAVTIGDEELRGCAEPL